MVGFALIGFFGATTPNINSVLNSDRFFSFLGAATFAGIFASIGHWADFEAIGRAPNPGYATSIRNTSILPVTILSVFVFNSPFHLIRLVGVFLILTGIITLLIEKKTESEEGKNGQRSKKSWVPQAFIAMTAYTLMVLGAKKATLLGFAPPEICLVIYIINFIFFIVICRNELRGYFEDKIQLKFFLPIALMCAFFAFTANLLNI
jgi:drug/metabolite transporter (DMT)-like permease